MSTSSCIQTQRPSFGKILILGYSTDHTSLYIRWSHASICKNRRKKWVLSYQNFPSCHYPSPWQFMHRDHPLPLQSRQVTPPVPRQRWHDFVLAVFGTCIISTFYQITLRTDAKVEVQKVKVTIWSARSFLAIVKDLHWRKLGTGSLKSSLLPNWPFSICISGRLAKAEKKGALRWWCATT